VGRAPRTGGRDGGCGGAAGRRGVVAEVAVALSSLGVGSGCVRARRLKPWRRRAGAVPRDPWVAVSRP